jgi:hypothetical protein
MRYLFPRHGLATAALWLATSAPAASAPAAVSRLTATLDDVPLERGGYHTLWVVDWAPVEGADGYELTYRTSEGASGRSTLLERPPLRLEVAGDERSLPSSTVRTAQLTAIGSLLALQVTPHFPGGRRGSPWPWLEVGRPYPPL